MLYHLLLTLIPGSWQVPRCSSPPPELASGDTAMVFPATKPGAEQLQLTVFSIYIIYNRPLQSTQANGIANTTQTPQLEPHLSLTPNLPPSLVAGLPKPDQARDPADS